MRSTVSPEPAPRPSRRTAVLVVASMLVVVLGGALLDGVVYPAWRNHEFPFDLLFPGEGTASIPGMLGQVDASAIERTAADLERFPTRAYGTDGNAQAADYLYSRLSENPRLDVQFQGGKYRNVLGILPGDDPDSGVQYVVGAHYDSTSSVPGDAPGVTDNACGVAIVLELSRVASLYRFNHTIVFAFWNGEEVDLLGSRSFAQETGHGDPAIPLYLNYDSSCYDPEDRFVLDLIYDDGDVEIADLMAANNEIYEIGFALSSNVHACSGDHESFWNAGYPALMTHQEEHGPAHTPQDTLDQASFAYARKNAQLGLSVLAMKAEVLGRRA